MVDAEALAENTAIEDNEKHVFHHTVNASEPGIQSKEGNKVIDTLGHGSSGGESYADQIQTGENVRKKEKKSNTETDKQSDSANPVSKKVLHNAIFFFFPDACDIKFLVAIVSIGQN